MRRLFEKLQLKSTATCCALSPHRLSKRYREDEQGIAAIEFAIIAPIMIVMYFGLAEIASTIAVDRKVSHAANVMGDLATQQPDLDDRDVEEIISATLRVIDVNDLNNVSVDIESFILPGSGQPPESRGRIQLNDDFGRFDASNLDDKLLNENSGIVVARIQYKYTPIELRFFDSTITLKETFMLKPRRSDSVEFNDTTCRVGSYSDVSCDN